jgi:hypothetical protein
VTAHGGSARPGRATGAHEDALAFFADYASLGSWAVLRRELREIEVPVTVLESPGAPPWVRAVARALAGLLPATGRDGPLDEADLVAALRELLEAINPA